MGGKAKNPKITQAEALSVFSYDAETGVVSLRKRTSPMDRRTVGASVGSLDAYGYLSVRLNGRSIKLHRLIWLIVTGGWPQAEIDHIDGDPANNRWANLRAATATQNSHNRRTRSTASLHLKGVSATKNGTFRAVIYKAGRQQFLGAYRTPEEAHAAYVMAAKRHFGEFARAK
jgi:hypothetical protein